MFGENTLAIQHKDIPEAQLHEPKGTSTSTVGQILTSTGGASAWATHTPAAGTVCQGVYDYNDLTTASTAIPLTVADTRYKLTNDAAGPFTNVTYALDGLANIWTGGSTDQFDWTDGTKLALGDTVDIRFDIEYTTTLNNTEVSLDLDLGVGDAGAYSLPIIDVVNVATAGPKRIVMGFSIYMGDLTTLNFPGEVQAKASKTGTTVKVNGWYVRVFHTNA